MKFQHAPAELLWSERQLAFHCPLAAGGKIKNFIYNNIPVSFDFITTWNQGVLLCSPCITVTLKLFCVYPVNMSVSALQLSTVEGWIWIQNYGEIVCVEGIQYKNIN
jgi:hypothetical protein